MPNNRTYSHYSLEAGNLLGKQIKLGRKNRKWSEAELAERAGISRATLQKIEKGDMSCQLGLVLEAASLVGLKLFDDKSDNLKQLINHTDNKIALLPKMIRKERKAVDDNF